MSKECTPLWREAHFEVKMYKTHQRRTTFGSWHVEKVHAVVARSTFRSQNAQHTTCSRHFWRFRCRFAWQAQGIVHLVKSEENVRVLYHFQPQPPLHYTTLQYITLHYNYNYNYTFTTFYYTPRHYTALNYIQLHYITLHYLPWHYITLHYTPLHYTSLHYTTTTTAQLHSTTLHRYTKLHYTTLHYTTRHSTTLHDTPLHSTTDVVLRGRHKGFGTLPKVSKVWGFCSISKNHGRRGEFEEDLQRCIFCGRRSTKDMFMRDVRRSGRWFPERGCILEHQICRFAKMILRDRCSTSYDLASIFSCRRSTLARWTGKSQNPLVRLENRKTHWYEAVSAALNFPCLKEVSQNCFVFDVVKFKNWRNLAELLRFGCCQVQKLQTSRRIVSFLMLSTSKNEEVSQNCLVFKLADRRVDR